MLSQDQRFTRLAGARELAAEVHAEEQYTAQQSRRLEAQADTAVGVFEVIEQAAPAGRRRRDAPPLPVDAAEWATFLDDAGRLVDQPALWRRIYAGGLDPPLRRCGFSRCASVRFVLEDTVQMCMSSPPRSQINLAALEPAEAAHSHSVPVNHSDFSIVCREAWKFLLGVYPLESTAAERADLMRELEAEYATVRDQWQRMTAAQAQRWGRWRERKAQVRVSRAFLRPACFSIRTSE